MDRSPRRVRSPRVSTTRIRTRARVLQGIWAGRVRSRPRMPKRSTRSADLDEARGHHARAQSAHAVAWALRAAPAMRKAPRASSWVCRGAVTRTCRHTVESALRLPPGTADPAVPARGGRPAVRRRAPRRHLRRPSATRRAGARAVLHRGRSVGWRAPARSSSRPRGAARHQSSWVSPFGSARRRAVIQRDDRAAFAGGVTLPRVLSRARAARRRPRCRWCSSRLTRCSPSGSRPSARRPSNAAWTAWCGGSGLRGVPTAALSAEPAGLDMIHLVAPTSTPIACARSARARQRVPLHGLAHRSDGRRAELPWNCRSTCARFGDHDEPICVGLRHWDTRSGRGGGRVADGVIGGSAIVQLVESTPAPPS